jgi:hypothetical protein
MLVGHGFDLGAELLEKVLVIQEYGNNKGECTHDTLV